jgi:hypothetical protein
MEMYTMLMEVLTQNEISKSSMLSSSSLTSIPSQSGKMAMSQKKLEVVIKMP